MKKCLAFLMKNIVANWCTHWTMHDMSVLHACESVRGNEIENVLRLKLISSVSQITRRHFFDAVAKCSQKDRHRSTPKKSLSITCAQSGHQYVRTCEKRAKISSDADRFFFQLQSIEVLPIPLHRPRISGWTLIFSITSFFTSPAIYVVLVAFSRAANMWNTILVSGQFLSYL